ncbi:MAG: molybdopterin converting factor subunit 1 [Acidobacteria bacterium]|nr:molybdopterin converting factor subunit 1 [Acidobacteriota bacterium]
MKVRLLLFAVLRDIVGTDERELEVADGSRAIDVWNGLRAAHPRIASYERPPFTAVNQDYVQPETMLRDGDELAFIPPVSGG